MKLALPVIDVHRKSGNEHVIEQFPLYATSLPVQEPAHDAGVIITWIMVDPRQNEVILVFDHHYKTAIDPEDIQINPNYHINREVLAITIQDYYRRYWSR